MNLSVLLFLSSGLFLGWSLGANSAANVFGTAVGTRMVRFATAATVCSVFVLLGAVLSGAGAAHTLGVLGSVNAIAGAFTAALAAAFTVYSMVRLGLSVSTSQAIVGAIVGWNVFAGAYTDPHALAKIMLTWVACPLLSAAIAVPLYWLTRHFLSHARIHLLRLDALTRLALLAAGALGSYSLGANNIANVMGVFVPVSPFTDLRVGNLFVLASVQQLFALGAVAIGVGVFTYSRRVMSTVGRNLVPMSPVAAWVVVVAQSVVLLLFSSQSLEHLLASAGLPTFPLVPVSSSQAVVGAVVGIGLMRGAQDINWRLLRNIAVGWVTTPLISATVCLVALFVVQNVFNQEVYREVSYELSAPVFRKLAEEGLASPRLGHARGREYHSARDFLSALHRHADLDAAQDRRALYYAEVADIYVDPARIDRLNPRWLTPAQRAALAALAGQEFRYRWRLAAALAARSRQWRLLPESKVNHLYNMDVQRKLDYVYRSFETTP